MSQQKTPDNLEELLLTINWIQFRDLLIEKSAGFEHLCEDFSSADIELHRFFQQLDKAPSETLNDFISRLRNAISFLNNTVVVKEASWNPLEQSFHDFLVVQNRPTKVTVNMETPSISLEHLIDWLLSATEFNQID